MDKVFDDVSQVFDDVMGVTEAEMGHIEKQIVSLVEALEALDASRKEVLLTGTIMPLVREYDKLASGYAKLEGASKSLRAREAKVLKDVANEVARFRLCVLRDTLDDLQGLLLNSLAEAYKN